VMAGFYLLRPECLPRGRDELASDVTAVLEPLATCYRNEAEPRALAAAHEALARLGLGPGDFQPVGEDPHESRENRDNDLVFSIVRVDGRRMPLLVHSSLQGYVALLDEALTRGTDLEPEAWGRLRAALHTVFDILLDRPFEREDGVPMAPPRSTAEGERDALRRWTRGHHVFMALLQGLIVVLNGLHRDLESADIPAARAGLERATALMWGTESAMRFAGDYDASAYERAVRPTLMPPRAPSDLTGLHWRDHEYLIKVLSGLRPLFSNLEPSLKPQHEAFYRAIAQAYDAHKLVCTRFVGMESASLFMAERSSRSAMEVLEHFKRARLQLVKR